MDYTELFSKLQEEVMERYKPKKERSLYLADIYDSLREPKRAEKVRECGTYLEFHLTNLRFKLGHANFCKDRLCPMCTYRRSMKTFLHVSRCIDFLAPRGYKYLFLTLTIKNCSSADLIKTIDLLNSAKVNLFRRAKIKKFLQGAFCALEITYNDNTGEWHPHLHCLLAVSSEYGKKWYLKHAEWRELWKDSAKLDYLPMLNIKAVKSANSEVIERLDSKFVITPKKALNEVTKYTVKDSEYLTGAFDRDRSLVSTLMPALYKRKLVSFSGCFIVARKQLKLDDYTDGDLVNIDGFSNNEMLLAIVRFHWCAGVYLRKVIPQIVSPFDSNSPPVAYMGFEKCS